jgi:hypothetical protein
MENRLKRKPGNDQPTSDVRYLLRRARADVELVNTILIH